MNYSRDSSVKYRQAIKTYTRSVESLQQNDPNASMIYWLSKEIYIGKRSLKYNSVDFIIGKFLTKQERVINFTKRRSVILYVIGTFINEFHPITKVAEAFAEFYLEMKVMPEIITITKSQFLADLNSSVRKINNGVLIYDRERNIH